jgi:hypothetical protein
VTLIAVDGLIDRARTPWDLEQHGLQLLATRRWRALGRPIPQRLLAQERVAAGLSLAAPAVLERVRAACDGDLLLVKGPEAAVACTVLEARLTSWLGPLWCCSRWQGIRVGTAALAADLRPLPEEGWRDKLVRARLALANARTGASHHYATLQGLRRERG